MLEIGDLRSLMMGGSQSIRSNIIEGNNFSQTNKQFTQQSSNNVVENLERYFKLNQLENFAELQYKYQSLLANAGTA
jgi:hypothetical protein